jgi:hypothetical protein
VIFFPVGNVFSCNENTLTDSQDTCNDAQMSWLQYEVSNNGVRSIFFFSALLNFVFLFMNAPRVFLFMNLDIVAKPRSD